MRVYSFVLTALCLCVCVSCSLKRKRDVKPPEVIHRSPQTSCFIKAYVARKFTLLSFSLLHFPCTSCFCLPEIQYVRRTPHRQMTHLTEGLRYAFNEEIEKTSPITHTAKYQNSAL